MILFLVLVLFAELSWAVDAARDTPSCKECIKTQSSVHFKENGKCRECIYKIYDELSSEYSDAQNELYCGCKFRYAPGGGCNIHFNGKGCFESGETNSCVSLEHILPKTLFNQDAELSNDFHNLFPAIKVINTARQDKYFKDAMIRGSVKYDKCKTSMDAGKTGRIYPRSEIKGDIARAYLYMIDRIKSKPGLIYGDLDLGGSLLQTLNDWNSFDPPTPLECKREKLIYEIQGIHNTYISNHPNCAVMK